MTVAANVFAHNFGGGVDLRDAHGCAVGANTFTIVPQRALAVGPKSGRITVTGNNFSDSNIGGEEKRRPGDRSASGIVLEGTTDVVVSGNLFSGLDTPAVALEGEPSRRILLSDNILTDLEQPAAVPADSRAEGNMEPEKERK